MTAFNTIQNARFERKLAYVFEEPTYFTGRPCKNGHVSERKTSDASCVACREVVAANPEKVLRKREKNKVSDAARRERDVEAHRFKNREWRRRYRLNNLEHVRELERKHGRIKRQRHPKRKLADTRNYQIAKLKRIPHWADKKAIYEFYKNCPPGYEVDHIVPLRGKTVSGLHIVGNLQYLPKDVNCQKGNRYVDDWGNGG